MTKGLTYFMMGVLASGILLYLFWAEGCLHSTGPSIIQTDTIYVDKPYKEIIIKEVEVEKPVKVYIYKTDTVYRERIERDTLITSVELTPRLAKIHTITPEGLPLITEYPLPEHRDIKIDHKGNMEVKRKRRRRKFWRRMERVGILVGGTLIGSRLAKR
ncbi:MAG: hypothetical protein JKY52_06530 [Flavobacteriales bacterium]|nr:hypothetical protein [Flavobacteriales bacterium]